MRSGDQNARRRIAGILIDDPVAARHPRVRPAARTNGAMGDARENSAVQINSIQILSAVCVRVWSDSHAKMNGPRKKDVVNFWQSYQTRTEHVGISVEVSGLKPPL
jgi:hypothetical protein